MGGDFDDCCLGIAETRAPTGRLPAPAPGRARRRSRPHPVLLPTAVLFGRRLRYSLGEMTGGPFTLLLSIFCPYKW